MGAGMGIGMGASIIGNELQGWANALERQAMAKTYQEELQKQGKYAAQAQGVLEPSIIGWGAGPANTAIAAGAAQRRANYANVAGTPTGPGASYAMGATPADQAYGQMLGAAKAQLGGYSDWMLNKSIDDLKTQQALNRISSFAGGVAQNVYPFRLYDAQHSQDVLSQIGQSISALGGAAANYAGMAQGAGQGGSGQGQAMPYGQQQQFLSEYYGMSPYQAAYQYGYY